MHFFDSYESTDKINSIILWATAIIGLFAATSTILDAVKKSKYSKIITITLAILTAIATLVGVYSGDHLSDL